MGVWISERPSSGIRLSASTVGSQSVSRAEPTPALGMQQQQRLQRVVFRHERFEIVALHPMALRRRVWATVGQLRPVGLSVVVSTIVSVSRGSVGWPSPVAVGRRWLLVRSSVVRQSPSVTRWVVARR